MNLFLIVLLDFLEKYFILLDIGNLLRKSQFFTNYKPEKILLVFSIEN